MKNLEVIVWACPTPECGNYYASASAGDLRTRFNQRKNQRNELVEQLPHSRCPDCRAAGRGEVDRIPVAVTVPVGSVVEAQR